MSNSGTGSSALSCRGVEGVEGVDGVDGVEGDEGGKGDEGGEGVEGGAGCLQWLSVALSVADGDTGRSVAGVASRLSRWRYHCGSDDKREGVEE